jgi:hypothetical protein
MENRKSPPLLIAIAPIVVLTALLFINILYFDDALGGANQTALIVAAVVCGAIGLFYGATQAKVLGVPTLTYLPFCFFNLLSPLINLAETVLNYKIRRINS